MLVIVSTANTVCVWLTQDVMCAGVSVIASRHLHLPSPGHRPGWQCGKRLRHKYQHSDLASSYTATLICHHYRYAFAQSCLHKSHSGTCATGIMPSMLYLSALMDKMCSLLKQKVSELHFASAVQACWECSMMAIVIALGTNQDCSALLPDY